MLKTFIYGKVTNIMNNIQLFNGNCMEILPQLNLKNCVIVSDPPFNVGYHYNSYNDKLSEDEYMGFNGGGIWGIAVCNHSLSRNTI